MPSSDTQFKKGMKHSPESIRKSALARTGKKRRALSSLTRERMSNSRIGMKLSDETKLKMRLSAGKGEKHHRWIKDRTQLKETRVKAYDTKYKYWMLGVKKRDSWKCRIADVNCDGRLEAHHILGWKSYPELRYDINNGITLCHAHHPRGRANEAKLSPYLQQLVAEMK